MGLQSAWPDGRSWGGPPTVTETTTTIRPVYTDGDLRPKVHPSLPVTKQAHGMQRAAAMSLQGGVLVIVTFLYLGDKLLGCL